MDKVMLIFFLLIANFSVASIEKFSTSRPNEKGEPTKVLVSFYITDIESIDNKNQSFTLDVIIRLKWDDPRLSEEHGPIPLNTIWHPNVQIYNLRDVDARFPEIATILQDGTVQYIQRYHAILSSHLNFKDFPFDVQTLTISLISFVGLIF
jgi:hypothetical protein